MLQQYAVDPKVYFKEYATSQQEQTDTVIAYYCLMCGLCKTICPQRLDLGQAFLSIRNDMARKNGGRVPLKALRTVNTHQNLSFCALFTALNRGG